MERVRRPPDRMPASEDPRSTPQWLRKELLAEQRATQEAQEAQVGQEAQVAQEGQEGQVAQEGQEAQVAQEDEGEARRATARARRPPDRMPPSEDPRSIPPRFRKVDLLAERL